MSCPENNGYEAWRLLRCDYGPSTGSRHVAMLSNLLKPQLGENRLEFWEKLRKCITDVDTNESSSGELVSESMKIAIEIQAAPSDIREKLQLRDFKTPLDFESKIEQYINTLCVWSSGSEPQPIDIGTVGGFNKGGKGNGNGKGKGKDKNFSQQMYHVKSAAKFTGTCHPCGKPSHKKDDCWRNTEKQDDKKGGRGGEKGSKGINLLGGGSSTASGEIGLIDLLASLPQHDEDTENIGDPFVLGLTPDDNANSDAS
jgi:hypothetical protein